MHREYDLFEKFQDGSTLWRACVHGLEDARHHLRDMAQKSRNQFYAIEMVSGKVVHVNSGRLRLDLFASSRIRERGKSAVA